MKFNYTLISLLFIFSCGKDTTTQTVVINTTGLLPDSIFVSNNDTFYREDLCKFPCATSINGVYELYKIVYLDSQKIVTPDASFTRLYIATYKDTILNQFLKLNCKLNIDANEVWGITNIQNCTYKLDSVLKTDVYYNKLDTLFYSVFVNSSRFYFRNNYLYKYGKNCIVQMKKK